TKMFTDRLLPNLTQEDDRPWATYRRGKPIDPRGLARLLRPFEVYPGTIRVGDTTSKGYTLEHEGKPSKLAEAIDRYVPPPTPTPVVTDPKTPSQPSQPSQVNNSADLHSVTDSEKIGPKNVNFVNDSAQVRDVTDKRAPQTRDTEGTTWTDALDPETFWRNHLDSVRGWQK